MDFEVIYYHISTSYWARNIPREVMQKAIANSLCFCVLTDDGQCVGFARTITDKATFAYLADVFIVPEYRGLGLSKKMLRAIKDHPELQGLRRFMLATRDAHELYRQFEFSPVAEPISLMQIVKPNIYSSFP
jgi:N-acetylglutamate synthase-like GNAT family acetyltransferase